MADVPLDRVQQLRAQGYDNQQLVDILQRDGFTSAQIFDAMNKADMPSAAPQPGQAMPPPPPPPQMNMPPTAPMPDLPPMGAPRPAPNPTTPPTPSSSPQPPSSAASSVSQEEYIEAIIDEKWTALEDDIRKVVEWKNRSEQRMQQLQSQVEDMKDRFEKLHAALIGKIETYDQNILEVGAEIKAMEKVFSKVLPVFTDNVKQLSDVAERIDERTR